MYAHGCPGPKRREPPSSGQADRLVELLDWSTFAPAKSLVESRIVKEMKAHTRIAPLRCVRSKRIASPVWLEKTEVRRGNRGKREDSEGREHHDFWLK